MPLRFREILDESALRQIVESDRYAYLVDAKLRGTAADGLVGTSVRHPVACIPRLMSEAMAPSRRLTPPGRRGSTSHTRDDAPNRSKHSESP